MPHQPLKLTKLMLWMEDHDNGDLPDGIWEEHLKEAVTDFNDENGTTHDPEDAMKLYQSYKQRQYWQK